MEYVSHWIDITSYKYIEIAKELGNVDHLVNVKEEDLAEIGNMMKLKKLKS